MAYGTRFTKAVLGPGWRWVATSFRSELERVAAEHATGTPADQAAQWTADDDAAAAGDTTTMTLRLPASVAGALKAAAEAEGTRATELARRWITERLTAAPPVAQPR